MKVKKVNFDRSVLSSEYIQNKQDLKYILNNSTFNQNKRLISPWFYGAIGFSSMLLLTGLTVVKNDKTYGNTTTLNKNTSTNK